MPGALRLLVLALGLATGAAPAVSQEAAQPGVVRSAILTVEVERLFSESAYGKRVSAEIEAEGAEIASENRRITAELTAEERRLTELRGTLEPTEFRELAEAFDRKVQELRREQDAKARALGNRTDERQRQFVAVAEPVLEQIMREAGAAVILDRRSVFLSAEAIDITETAISRIDAEIGDGSDGDETPPQPAAPRD